MEKTAAFTKALFGALDIDEPAATTSFPAAQLLRIAFLVPDFVTKD